MKHKRMPANIGAEVGPRSKAQRLLLKGWQILSDLKPTTQRQDRDWLGRKQQTGSDWLGRKPETKPDWLGRKQK